MSAFTQQIPAKIDNVDDASPQELRASAGSGDARGNGDEFACEPVRKGRWKQEQGVGAGGETRGGDKEEQEGEEQQEQQEEDWWRSRVAATACLCGECRSCL